MIIKCKSCKRQYIWNKETLTVREVSDLITVKEDSSYSNSEKPVKRVRAERRCGCCSKIGHNSYTCKVEIEDTEDSNASK